MLPRTLSSLRALGPSLPLVGLGVLTLALVPLIASPRGALLLAAAGGVFLTIFLMRRPHWGLVLILTFWFVEINPTGVRYLSVPYVVTLILLVPLGVALMRERTIAAWSVPQVRILLGIAVVLVMSTVWSQMKFPEAPLPALDTTTRSLQLFLTRFGFLVLLLQFLRTRRQIHLIVLTVAVLIVVAGGDALMQFGRGAARAHSSFGLTENANRLAFSCLFGISLLWFYRTHAVRPRWGFLTLPAIFLLAAAALATGSRSGFLQSVVLGLFLLKEQRRWSPARRLQSMAVLLALVMVVAAAVPSAQLIRGTTFDPARQTRGQESLRNRINTVVGALELSLENPVLGIGVGNFRWLHQVRQGRTLETHNSYLWALTGAGPFALGLYLLLFLVTYRTLRWLHRHAPPDLRWLVKALRVNLILFLLFSAFADFWLSEFLYLLVGLTAVLASLARRESAVAARPRAVSLAAARRLVTAAAPAR